MPATHRWIWSICSGRATVMRASLWSRYLRCLFLISTWKEPFYIDTVFIVGAEKSWPNYVQWLLGNGTGWGLGGGDDTGVRQGCSEPKSCALSLCLVLNLQLQFRLLQCNRLSCAEVQNKSHLRGRPVAPHTTSRAVTVPGKAGHAAFAQ